MTPARDAGAATAPIEAAPWARDAWFTLTLSGDGSGTSIHCGWSSLCAAVVEAHYFAPDPEQHAEVISWLTEWDDWKVAPDGNPWSLQRSYEDGRVLITRITIAGELDGLVAALRSAIAIAEEARLEWDAAPSGMRAGKLLIALASHIKGYRRDIDAIHAALAKVSP